MKDTVLRIADCQCLEFIPLISTLTPEAKQIVLVHVVSFARNFLLVINFCSLYITCTLERGPGMGVFTTGLSYS